MGKKILKIMISVVLATALFVGCSSVKYGPISGYVTPETAPISNGGFVAEYGEYTYFVNGIDYNYSDNTLTKPIKSSLYRVKTSDIASESAKYDRIVPKLFVSGTYKMGFYISGDFVYYATPNTLKNKQGIVEYTYLDFNRTKLDGTGTTKILPINRNYFSDSAMEYRFMEVDNTLYIVYVNDSKLYSYNTQTNKVNVLIEDYTSYIFSNDISDNNIYYTKEVKEGDLELPFPYNHAYQIKADGKAEKLILNGVGKINEDATTTISPENRTFTLLQASKNFLYITAKATDKNAKETAHIIDLNNLVESEETEALNAVENYEQAFKYKKSNLTNFTKTTLFKGNEYIFYVDSTYGITRESFNASPDDFGLAIDVKAKTATLLNIVGNYLYYYTANESGGNILSRIKYNGTENDYKYLPEIKKDCTPQKIGDVNLHIGWFSPEIINNNLFYLSADALSYKYVYVYDLSKLEDEEYKSAFIGERNADDEKAYKEAMEKLEEENK